MSDISVIIPTLNEAENITCLIQHTRILAPENEIIVVDGGSSDGTAELAVSAGAVVVKTEACRGRQFNAGAERATNDWLFFLHADSELSEDSFQVLSDYITRGDFQAGTFRLAFDRSSRLLNLYAYFSRFDSIFTSFGDQGIVIHRNLFEKLGRFPDWKLFEDVELLRKIRRVTKAITLPSTVRTSSRRFIRNGIIKTQLHNGLMMAQYLMGVSPDKLAKQYYLKGISNQREPDAFEIKDRWLRIDCDIP